MAERRLRVEIDAEHPVAIQRGGMREMQRHRGLAGTALEIGDRGAEGAACRTPGPQRLAARLELAAQGVDLVQGEPALAPVRLDLTRG